MTVEPQPQPQPQPQPHAGTEKRGAPWKRVVGAVVLLAAVAAGANYGVKAWLHARDHESTDDAFVEAHVVRVSARVAGHVARVLFVENEEVAAGAPLIELDPRDLEARVAGARAELETVSASAIAAAARIEEARAGVLTAEANLATVLADEVAAASDVSRTAEDLARYDALVARGSMAEQRLDHARADARAAASRLDATRTRAGAADAAASAARRLVATRAAEATAAVASIERARASLRAAELDLSYARVAAPAAGRIARKAVEPGDFVQVGQPLCALIPREVWVIANFKETQIARMRPGARVDIRVDAFPGLRLRGHVDSLLRGSGARFSLFPPENATGNYVKVVQRVPVKIVFDGEVPEELGPGMSVEPDVEVGHSGDADAERR